MAKHLLAAAVLVAAPAFADTIVTDFGVTFDGVVKETPQGLYEIKAGDNVLYYQKSEIVSIEKNEKTGHLDLQAIAEEVKKTDAELLEKTGLTQSQRARVDALLPDLMQDGAPHTRAKQSLVAMADECDVYKYLEYLYQSSTPYLQIQMLDVLMQLDSTRAVPRIRESLTNAHSGVRAKAIEFLATAGDTKSVGDIARGLVDPDSSVRIAAAYALANLNERAATPALIESLTHPDLRVSGAAKESLAQLWKDVLGDKRPVSVDEWNALWNANRNGIGTAISQSDLQPLADPAAPFVNG